MYTLNEDNNNYTNDQKEEIRKNFKNALDIEN